jgi:ketosteroid isomerase-like protein
VVDFVYSQSASKAREKLRRLEGHWVEDHKFYSDQDDDLSVKRRKRVAVCVYVPVAAMSVLAIFLAVSTLRTMTAKKAEIEAVNAKWIELFNRGDFAGVGSLYTADATALPPGSGMVRGDAAIGAMWKSIAEQVGDPNLMTLEVKSLGPTTAQEIGTYSLKTKGPNPKAVTGKYLVVWEKIGNDWKLVADIWNDGQ